jgi:phospholipase D1/2
MRQPVAATTRSWFRVVVVSAGVATLAVVGWLNAPADPAGSVQAFMERFAAHRTAWYALPAVALAFVVLGLAMVPVLLLITATGVVFGPLLGPVFAMVGCLASASVGFAIGRWTGLGHVQRLGGERVTRIVRSLERNGTMAVFLLRKIPAPFLLANVVAGASGVRYRDFMLGTLLGMGAAVTALAGFGYQLTNIVESPSPATVLGAMMFIGIPLTLAWLINRRLRERNLTV